MWYSLIDSATIWTVAVTQFALDVNDGQELLSWPEGVDPIGSFYEPVKDPETGVISLVENIEKKTQAAWSQLRTERNARLAASDYTQLQDAHLSAEKKSAWADYRQALRDLPENATDPTQVTWPVSPSQ